jgi:hypothetical protein
MKPKPDFLIIGAAKAGTTTLHEQLKRHPEIFLPEEKDFKYFDRDENYSKGWPWYRNYFRNYAGQARLGEANSEYLFSKKAARRIYDDLGPDVKLVAIIRNPAERAYSEYLHQKRYGQADRDFDYYLNKDNKATDKSGKSLFDIIVGRSLYSTHIKEYLSVFNSANLKIVILEKLKNNPGEGINEIFEFLGVQPMEDISLLQANRAYTPRYAWMNNLLLQPNLLRRTLKRAVPSFAVRKKIRAGLKRVNTAAGKNPMVLTPDRRKALMNGPFREETNSLETLLGIRIPEWNKGL